MPCEAGVALSYAVEFEYVDIESQRAGALGRAPAPGHGARGGDVVPAACGVRVPGKVTSSAASNNDGARLG